MRKRKLPSGLIWRGEIIHINTTIGNREVRQTTKTDNVKEALTVLDDLRFKQRRQSETGESVGLDKTWAEALNKYLDTTYHKNQEELKRKFRYLECVIPLTMRIKDIYNSTLDPVRAELKNKGRKANTVNDYIKVVRQVLNKCLEWEEAGIPWITEKRHFVMEKFKKNPIKHMNQKQGTVITWEEQDRLFGQLPVHLKDAALYAVNTGARMGEITNLKWSWEIYFPTLKVKAFRIPGEFHKNERPKIVVLNSIAKSIIEKKRGEHPEFVFTYKGNKIKRLNASAWRKARARVNLTHVTVHDLRHTFATRLARYGVSEVDIKILLGHVVPGVTATYAFTTQALEPMIENCEKVVGRKPMTFLEAGEFKEFYEEKTAQKPHKPLLFSGVSND